MTILQSPAVCAVFCLLIVLHVAASIFIGKVTKIINIMNITLHIALIFLLLICKIPIDEAVLLYMISTLAYTLARYIKSSLEKRGDGDDV